MAKTILNSSLKVRGKSRMGVRSVDRKKRRKTDKQDKKDGKMYDSGNFQ
jgi:hypothetical protein